VVASQAGPAVPRARADNIMHAMLLRIMRAFLPSHIIYDYLGTKCVCIYVKCCQVLVRYCLLGVHIWVRYCPL
jgi:hypothetical protein